MSLVLEGRCWKFGDEVSSDALISAQHVFEYDPKALRKHLLAEDRPEFAARAQAGDLIVAGRRFAHGSQHSHPFLAMKEIGVGLLAVGLSRAPFRLAIYMGVPVLEIGEDVWQAIAEGDCLRVDFLEGSIENTTTGHRFCAQALPGFLMEIVQAGGGLAYLRERSTASRERDDNNAQRLTDGPE